MRVKLQLIICSDDGHEETVTDIVTLKKDCQRIEHLGLTLVEAKQILKTLQQRVLRQQVDAFLTAHSTCPDCGVSLKTKGYHTRTFRTLFGTCKLASPRLFHCRCTRRKTTSFRPLSALLMESAAPELLFMETKWASLVSYGLTVEALRNEHEITLPQGVGYRMLSVHESSMLHGMGAARMPRYSPAIEAQMRMFYQSLSEKDRCRYAAIEARKLGRGEF